MRTAILVLFGVAAALAAAQTQFPLPLAEKIEVNVVNVDVTVTDHGKPVNDLTRDDFELFDDGQAQPITNFYVVTNARTAHAETVAAPIQPEVFRRKVLVLVDNATTTKHDRNEALKQLEQFIDERFEGDYAWSIASIDTGVHLNLPMTRDKATIHSALLKIRSGGTSSWAPASGPRLGDSFSADGGREKLASWLGEGELAQRQNFDSSCASALADSVRAFGAIEGRKIILLVTGHLAFDEKTPVMLKGNPGVHIQHFAKVKGRLVNMKDFLIAEANASNTSIYIVSAEALGMRSVSSLYWLARMTGGKYLPSNYVRESLADFDKLSASFYALGYRPRHDEDGRYHDIKVRVKGHPSYRLQFRAGYASMTNEEQLVRTLRSFVGATMQAATFPIATTLDAPQYEKSRVVVPLHVSIPMDRIEYLADATGSRGRINLYLSIFDENGRNLALRRIVQEIRLEPNEQTAQRRIVMNVPAVAMTKGRSYRIVIAVRDEITEAVGISVDTVSV
jgi:VWFA-related protein